MMLHDYRNDPAIKAKYIQRMENHATVRWGDG